ncbi:MAG: hypothetical protein ACI3YH_08865 [Eubacteriales bacterium]
MKKTISILSLCLACLLCGACASQTADQANTTAELTMPPLPTEYTLLGAVGENSSSDIRFNKFVDSTRFGIGTHHVLIEESDVAAKSRSPYGDDRVFVYKTSKRTYKNNQNTDYGSSYSHYYIYESENGARVEYLANTDLIVGYRDNHSATGTCPEFSDDEIKSISDAFVLQHMSEENFAKFTFDSVTRDAVNRYTVSYTRYLYGYPTDETIYIAIEEDGVPETYSAPNLCKYDSVLVSQENIEAAQSYLYAQIEAMELADLHHYPTRVITNADGEVYLWQMIAYTNAANETVSTVLYINVN